MDKFVDIKFIKEVPSADPNIATKRFTATVSWMAPIDEAIEFFMDVIMDMKIQKKQEEARIAAEAAAISQVKEPAVEVVN